MKKILSKDYYNSISKGYKNLYHKEQIKKINNVKNIIEKINSKNNLKILDIGCGDGVLNNFFNLQKNKLFSIDCSSKLLKLNNSKNKILCDFEFEKIPFLKNEIDYIFSFSVLQDIFNYKKVLLECKKILKENGIFILSFIKLIKNKKEIEFFLNKNFIIQKKIICEIDEIFILRVSKHL